MATVDIDGDDAADSYHTFSTPRTRIREADDRAARFDDERTVRSRQQFESRADMASWAGQPAVKGSTETMRMALLTLSMAGLQYVWALSELISY
jgi:hypothetical protein